MTFVALTDEAVDKVTKALWRSSERGDVVGLDTEFYGVDPREKSCAGGRAKIHIWSIAVKRWPHVLNPRGYYESESAVLLASALEHPRLREWLESQNPKALHNLPVDYHALRTSGITLGGAIDTLPLARWALPGRARGAGFTLDSLGQDLLGFGKVADFVDVTSEYYVHKLKTLKVCLCGVWKCRKRHPRSSVVIGATTKTRRVPLESITPEHHLWPRLVEYAAADSIVGLGLHDVLTRYMRKELPWPYYQRTTTSGSLFQKQLSDLMTP